MSDKNVKGIFVNIFGGIVRCDLIAEGILFAAKDVGITMPVVVRLEGNNAERGLEILSQSDLNLTPVQGLNAAAENIVSQVRGVA
jgi:succinyl-CoA synthetase beta subunit